MQAGLLLTEVRFAPVAGDSAFVEVSNTSSTDVDVTGATLRLGSKDLALDGLAQPLAPEAQVLVMFDTLGTTEGNVIHGPSGFGLAPDTGMVELLDRSGAPLDRVAWGQAQPDGVPLTDGALVPDVIESGTTIGRAPGATGPGRPYEWAVFAPVDASPGRPNPMPLVGVLLPLSGSVLEGTQVTLAWYPVADATSYRVQLSADPAFSSPLLDTSTTEPQFDTGPLPPGEYVWRVVAVNANGTSSRFSAPSTFELQGRVALAVEAVARARVALFVDEPGKQLSVPLLSQRKDTSMLLLERNEEHGAHAWDVDHVSLDTHDPADNKNCGIASVAMVNHFFGGDLSQDRIGYELWKRRVPTGPEFDLNYGFGIEVADVTKALTFALGAAPIHRGVGQTPDEVWADVTASIDAGRPVLAAGLKHVFVVTGYEVEGGKRLFSYNDPWNYPGRSGALRYDMDAHGDKSADILDTWVPPPGANGTRQEPSIKADSDGDGVVDFDEVERFHTNPNDPDSDGDKLPDKPDVVTGVFDSQFGYARDPLHSTGRDYDFDDVPTERDPDSDRGGCQDGDEDKDFDGHRTGSETWNFDTQDDRCSGWRGTMTASESWDVTYGHGTATSTFEGVWEIDEAGDAECPPDPAGGCVLFRPTGKIAWTWDSHHTEEGRTCSSTTAGSTETGHELHSDQQVLHLRAVDPDHLEYWGVGNFTLPPPALTCNNMQSGSVLPPRFFEIQGGSSDTNNAGSDGNSCWPTTWQIDAKADTIKGSCFAYKNDHTSLAFEWNLRRLGGAPSG